MDIWDMVVDETKKKEEQLKTSVREDATLLIIGSKKTGKTTVIYRFLARDEPPKPTLALEYTFGRQSRSNVLSKDVCHIWELGGGTLFMPLLEVPISETTLTNLVIVIMVDLSLPHELLATLTSLLDAVRNKIEQILNSEEAKTNHLKEKLLESAWKRLGEDHQDRNAIKPCLVPLVIIGGKYDIFQNFEPEQCKIICRTLRQVAHTNGATLQFFSSRMENLVTRARAVLSHHVFGTALSNYISQDYTKPLVIPAGTDSLQQIAMQHDSQLGAGISKDWKNVYETHFPQAEKKFKLPEDPAKDPNFKEALIDNLRAQKDDELEQYKKELSNLHSHLDMDI